jgi:hypothetical protein
MRLGAVLLASIEGPRYSTMLCISVSASLDSILSSKILSVVGLFNQLFRSASKMASALASSFHVMSISSYRVAVSGAVFNAVSGAVVFGAVSGAVVFDAVSGAVVFGAVSDAVFGAVFGAASGAASGAAA